MRRPPVELRPNALVHLKLGNALATLGKDREAVSEYQAALALRRDLIQAANNLAWILATTPDDGLRDGKRAVTIAERICSLNVEGKRGEHLDTLAAAFAESGRFAEAVQAAEKAIPLARSENDAAAARSMEARLVLYRQYKAFRNVPR